MKSDVHSAAAQNKGPAEHKATVARDFEITKRCAEAMGMKFKVDGRHVWIANSWNSKSFSGYAPLLNDEQAMSLVKRFNLDVTWDDGEWDVSPPPGPVRPLTDTRRS